MIDTRGTTEADYDFRPVSGQQTPKDGVGEPIAVPGAVSGDDYSHSAILADVWTQEQYPAMPTVGAGCLASDDVATGLRPRASATLDDHRHSAYERKHGAYVERKGFVVLKKPVRVTDAELAVLKVLWARGPLTAKAITETVYPDGAESEFAAAHSFLQRLERKGLVARDRNSFVHIFSPTASRADVLGQELNTLVERLGCDSIAPLIMQLIDQKRLSRKEAAEIRALLDKHLK